MTYIHSACDFCGQPVVRQKQAASRNVKLHFCNLECKGNWQRKAKPVTEEWLREHYLEKGMDCTQIARLVERDPKSVWNWLKDFGIPTRSRGSACPERHFQKGHQGIVPGFKHSEETKRRMREIALADGRVPYDPAVGSYMKGRKGADTPAWKGGCTPERQAFYASQEWQTVARAVKKRDNHTCQRCGKVKVKGDGEPFDIHHIVSFACVALRAVLSNLIYLCEPCHYWVHSRENVECEFLKEEGEE